MKSSKIASIFYYVILAISLLVLGAFYFIGFDNMESLDSGYYTSPQFTDLLMYWMYFLVAVATIATVIGAVTSKGGKVDSNMPKWGKVLAQVGLWLFLPAIIIFYFLGDATPLRTGSGLYEDTFWLVATDAILYTIYVLVIVTVLGLLVNLSGIFKK